MEAENREGVDAEGVRDAEVSQRGGDDKVTQGVSDKVEGGR